MNIRPMSVAKFAVAAVVGIGTGKIIEKTIKSIITPTSIIDKVAITAATWAISAMAAEATKKYTDEMIDDLTNTVHELVQTYKMNEKMNRINTGKSTFEKEGLDPSNFKQHEKSGHWIPKDVVLDGKVLGANSVIEILKSDEWQHTESEGGWVSRNKQGKILSWIKEIRNPNGSVKWVLIDAD